MNNNRVTSCRRADTDRGAGARPVVPGRPEARATGGVGTGSACAAVILIVLAAATPLPGQAPDPSLVDESDSRWIKPAEVEELERYLQDRSEPDLTVDELIELSRLLSEPQDQINWLIREIEEFVESDGKEVACALIEGTATRLSTWRGHEISGPDQLADRLEDIKKVACPGERLVDILNPAQLKARVEQEDKQDLSDLSGAEKFVLLARGVARKTLGLGTSTDWNQPRAMVARLGGGAGDPLPEILTLINLEGELRKARGADGAFDAVSPHVGDTFRIADALLGRAMGVDGRDRGAADDDESSFWATLAGELEGKNLWTWAALARILQAATMSAPTSDTIELARQQWEKVLAVDSDPRLPVGAWLVRFRDGPLEEAGLLPLSDSFREQRRAERSVREEACQSAIERRDIDDAFTQMQLAKAAEAGLLGDGMEAPKTATIQDLKKSWSHRDGRPWHVHLYLELLEVAGLEDANSVYYGIAIGLEGDQLQPVTGGISKYTARSFRPESEPKVIVENALKEVYCSPEQKLGGRILIAPDHSICRDHQMSACEKVLLDFLGKNENSWFVYVPTAAALLDGSPWKRAPTLRYWHQSSLAYAGGIYVLQNQTGTRTWEVKELGNLGIPGANQMYAVSLGGAYPEELDFRSRDGTDFLKQLMGKKNRDADGAAAVLPFVLFEKD